MGYHSREDLHDLGVRVRDTAIRVCMKQADSYEAAQQGAVNDQTRVASGQTPQVANYTPPADGSRPVDKAAVESYIRQAYDQVPQWFTAFSVPDPESVKPLTERLYRTANTLEPHLNVTAQGASVSASQTAAPLSDTTAVGQSVGYIGTHMKHWEGDAANSFSGYVKRLAAAASLQRELTVSLAVGVEAQQEIRRRMLNDVWDAGEKTIKVLESLEDTCPGKQTITFVITVVGAIGAVAVVAASGGGAAVGAGGAIALDGAGAAIGVESLQSLAAIMGLSASGAAAAEGEISGATVPQVMDSVRAALNKIMTGTNEQEAKLSGCMKQLMSGVRAVFKSLYVEPPGFQAIEKEGLEDLRKNFYDR